jgi:hypothetical protein
VIAEFGQKAQVFMANLLGHVWQVSFSDLFPQSFLPEHLQVRSSPERGSSSL